MGPAQHGCTRKSAARLRRQPLLRRGLVSRCPLHQLLSPSIPIIPWQDSWTRLLHWPFVEDSLRLFTLGLRQYRIVTLHQNLECRPQIAPLHGEELFSLLAEADVGEMRFEDSAFQRLIQSIIGLLEGMGVAHDHF